MNESEMLKNIRNLKSDNLFSPSDLDELNNESRKNIEFELLLNVLQGNIKFYKYIPYIACFDIEKEILSKMKLEELSEENIISLFIELYKKNSNIDLLAQLKNRVNDYSNIKKELNSLLMDEELDDKSKSKIYYLLNNSYYNKK